MSLERVVLYFFSPKCIHIDDMFYRMVLRFRSNAIKNWGCVISVELIFRLYASMQDVHEQPKKDALLSAVFWMKDNNRK